LENSNLQFASFSSRLISKNYEKIPDEQEYLTLEVGETFGNHENFVALSKNKRLFEGLRYAVAKGDGVEVIAIPVDILIQA
jgi:hypothetical protein